MPRTRRRPAPTPNKRRVAGRHTPSTTVSTALTGSSRVSIRHLFSTRSPAVAPAAHDRGRHEPRDLHAEPLVHCPFHTSSLCVSFYQKVSARQIIFLFLLSSVGPLIRGAAPRTDSPPRAVRCIRSDSTHMGDSSQPCLRHQLTATGLASVHHSCCWWAATQPHHDHRGLRLSLVRTLHGPHSLAPFYVYILICSHCRGAAHR